MVQRRHCGRRMAEITRFGRMEISSVTHFIVQIFKENAPLRYLRRSQNVSEYSTTSHLARTLAGLPQQIFQHQAQLGLFIAVFHDDRRVHTQVPLRALAFRNRTRSRDHHGSLRNINGIPGGSQHFTFHTSYTGVPRVRIVPAASTAFLRTMVPS